MGNDDSQPPGTPGPSRLELNRELQALRVAVGEREGWIGELKHELTERDAALGWREQEVRTAAAETAAARRESAQYREDRDHARRQLHARAEELTQSLARERALNEEVDGLRAERRKRQAETIELRASLEGALSMAGESPAVTADRDLAVQHGQEILARELGEARAQAARALQAVAAVEAELAVVHEATANHAAAAMAGRVREIELLHRLSSQGDDLAVLRAEVEQLHTVLADERHSAEVRAAALLADLASLGNSQLDTDERLAPGELSREDHGKVVGH